MPKCPKCKKTLIYKLESTGKYVCMNCKVKRFTKSIEQRDQRRPMTFRAYIYPDWQSNTVYRYKEPGCIPCKITVAYPHCRKLGNKNA